MDIDLVQNKIFTLRGQKVMLDFDPAEIYGTQTKRLKEKVRRNLRRSPKDFMFELTNDEWQSLRSQIASSKRGGIRYTPFAFTEWAVAMLSSVVNSDISIEINIVIMKAFVAARQILSHSPIDKFAELQNEFRELKEYLNDVLTDQNDINEDTRVQLELVNRSLAELQAGKRLSDYPRRRIGFVGDEE